MSTRRIRMTDTLESYLDGLLPEEPAVMARLREETAGLEMAAMQIGYDQARFMQLLVRAIGARRTIEIGVFTGYSALATALALPDSGRIVACDISHEWTAIAQRYWGEAGIAHKIDLRLRPAAETLDELLATQGGVYDFAFIDADKTGYQAYFDKCLELLRPGGLIILDNALWGGAVADPDNDNEDTIAIRQVNRNVSRHPAVEACLAPIGDGLHLAWKK